jgi:hypothetical protein
VLYENGKAQFYDPPGSGPIEEKYVSLLEKRGFKKYRNAQMS